MQQCAVETETPENFQDRRTAIGAKQLIKTKREQHVHDNVKKKTAATAAAAAAAATMTEATTVAAAICGSSNKQQAAASSTQHLSTYYTLVEPVDHRGRCPDRHPLARETEMLSLAGDERLTGRLQSEVQVLQPVRV